VVYKIPCKNCERVYVGETGRPLGARVKEHRKEVDRKTGIFTWEDREGEERRGGDRRKGERKGEGMPGQGRSPTSYGRPMK